MKKRLAIIVAFVCILTSTVACSSENKKNISYYNDLYRITTQNGQTYLTFADPHSSTDDENTYGMIALQYPHFSSVSEMKHYIETGNIPAEELSGIRAKCNKDGVLEICDLDSLYDLSSLPNNVDFSEICWTGKDYEFYIESRLFETGALTVIEKEQFKQILDDEFIDPLGPSATIISEEEIADRNATRINYTLSTGEFYLLQYEIQNLGRTLYVQETYVKEIYDKESALYEKVSTEVPTTISVFCEGNTSYFWLLLDNLAERPSTEWFTSFVLKPYK